MSEFQRPVDPFDELAKQFANDSQFVTRMENLNDELDLQDMPAIPITDDIKRLRDAFHDHVKSTLQLAPGADLSGEDYSYIEFIMNRTDVTMLEHLAPGDTVEVQAGPFVVYPTDRGLACENIVEGEAIIGEFHHMALTPVPTLEAMALTGEGIDDTAVEPAIVLTNPRLEIDGELQPHALNADYIVVAVTDSEAVFLKRQQPTDN